MAVSNATLEVRYGSYGVNWLNVASLTLAGGATLQAANQYQVDNGDIGFLNKIGVIGTNTVYSRGGSYSKNLYFNGGMTGDVNAVINLTNGHGTYDGDQIMINGGIWSGYLGTVKVVNDMGTRVNVDLLNARVNVAGNFYLGGPAGSQQSGGPWPNLLVQFGELSGAGLLYANGQTGGEWRIGNLGTSCTYSGVIDGASKLTKVGGGTLTVKGNSTYTGGTTVSNGVLLVDNTAGSGTGTGTVTVVGGTLGGTGVIAGAVAISPAGTVAPGGPSINSGVGVLTTASNVLFQSGAVFAVQISSNGLGDKLVSSMTVSNLGATLSVSLVSSNIPAVTSFTLMAASNIV